MGRSQFLLWSTGVDEREEVDLGFITVNDFRGLEGTESVPSGRVP
jgi:hypothetical protein